MRAPMRSYRCDKAITPVGAVDLPPIPCTADRSAGPISMAGHQLLLALAVLASAGLCAANAPLGFIRAQDSRFVDKDCNEFNFVGTNACAPRCRRPAARPRCVGRGVGAQSPDVSIVSHIAALPTVSAPPGRRPAVWHACLSDRGSTVQLPDDSAWACSAACSCKHWIMTS